MRGGPKFSVWSRDAGLLVEAYFRFSSEGIPYFERLGLGHKGYWDDDNDWTIYPFFNQKVSGYRRILKRLHRDFRLTPSEEGVRDIRKETTF
jgi:hypothetical protein